MGHIKSVANGISVDDPLEEANPISGLVNKHSEGGTSKEVSLTNNSSNKPSILCIANLDNAVMNETMGQSILHVNASAARTVNKDISNTNGGSSIMTEISGKTHFRAKGENPKAADGTKHTTEIILSQIEENISKIRASITNF